MCTPYVRTLLEIRPYLKNAKGVQTTRRNLRSLAAKVPKAATRQGVHDHGMSVYKTLDAQRT